MISYAIGIFSVLLLLLLLLFYCRLKELTKKNMLVLGSFLAMLVYTQYQILFFIPAFFSALFLWHVKDRYDVRGKIIKFLPAGFSFLLVFLPLYLFFIRRSAVQVTGINAGRYYNAGPSGEFLFLVNPTAGILENIKYFFQFFFENNIIVLQTMTAFVPEGSYLYLPTFLLVLILFTTGIVGFIKADGVIRQIGLFFMFTWITWMILVLVGQITLSPTRHSLVLLPLMVITICQGSYFICDRIQRMSKRLKYIHSITAVVLSVFVIATFLYHIGEFKKARTDRFDESEIENILQQQAVDSIMLHRCTYNLVLMKSINNKYPIFYGCGGYWKSNAYVDNYKISGRRIAFVGMGSEMSEGNFEDLTSASNELVGMNIFNNTFRDHKLIFSKKKPSGSQMEFSNRTGSQINGFAMYVYERIDTN
jgi:4-amino-4-deoxy-L-arabinose transferase-like glycosyltransferase